MQTFLDWINRTSWYSFVAWIVVKILFLILALFLGTLAWLQANREEEND